MSWSFRCLICDEEPIERWVDTPARQGWDGIPIGMTCPCGSLFLVPGLLDQTYPVGTSLKRERLEVKGERLVLTHLPANSLKSWDPSPDVVYIPKLQREAFLSEWVSKIIVERVMGA